MSPVMCAQMLQTHKSQLLIIDVQEKLLPLMADPPRVVRGCAILLHAAAALHLPTLISEQYPKGLGPTVAPLKEHAAHAHIVEKTHFSCLGDPQIAAQLHPDRPQFVLGGIESHVCVLQTALHLKERGHDVYVVADAVSSRKHESTQLAFERLRQAGIELITVEMALFEWLQKSGTETFRTLSALIKEPL